jgi:L-ascorbate metabolism protein UlaG (beta-lactamase superfamily)
VLQIQGGPTIYHTGDTDVYGDMRLIPEHFKIDLVLACIGGHFTMDPVRAAEATRSWPARRRSSRRRLRSAASAAGWSR